MSERIKCGGCGIPVEDSGGATHEYIGAAAGCWAIFGEILAREFNNPGYFYPAHRLTVDTYAVQHPGVPGRKSIQSVNVHLAALYLNFETTFDFQGIPKVMAALTKNAQNFAWLEPPAPNGTITVLDVIKAENAGEHQEIVKNWAGDVWSAWSVHHQKIKELVAGYIN
ncbi:MAG TPA: DUF5946 family protein [Pyrinomonadaceae bacterium]|jgi:hypothetical protein